MLPFFQLLYEFVFFFFFLNEDAPFSLCHGLPLKYVPCSDKMTIAEADLDSLLTIGTNQQYNIDPLKLLPFTAEISF